MDNLECHRTPQARPHPDGLISGSAARAKGRGVMLFTPQNCTSSCRRQPRVAATRAQSAATEINKWRLGPMLGSHSALWDTFHRIDSSATGVITARGGLGNVWGELVDRCLGT